MAETLQPDTGNALVDAVLHAAHRIRTAADAELRTQGLSLSSYKALRALNQEPCSMRALSELLRVAPRTITDIVDGLERHGFAERGAHPCDRRVTLLRITREGRARLRRARRAVERARDASIGGLAEPEQEMLVNLLARVDPGTGAAVGARAVPTAAT